MTEARMRPTSGTAFPLSGVSRIAIAAAGPNHSCLPVVGPIVKEPQAEDENGDGDGDGGSSSGGTDLGVMRCIVDVDGQPRANGGRGREHEIVAVSPDEGSLEIGEEVVHRPIEIHPPHREGDEEPAHDQGNQRRQRFAGRQRRLDGDRRREDRFSEHDEGEQAVTFGDVMRVPRSLSGALRPRGDQEFTGDQRDKARAPVLRNPEHADPRDLQHRDADRVANRRRPPFRIGRCRPQPLSDHRQSHHDVANDDREVGRVRLEHGRDAGGEDQGAGNLDEDGEPVRHVVAVVGRRKPCEVHPRPPDGKEHHRVAGQPGGGVRFGDRVVQAARDLRDGDDEDQIEEQLERRRRAVRLVRRSRRHRDTEFGAGNGRMVAGRGAASLRVILSGNRLPVYA